MLDLGLQPLANRLLTPAALALPEPRYPLRLALCTACGLLQLTHIVPPERLFSEYLYFSSVSESLVRHGREVAERCVREFALDASSFVVEIASNDGYLLRNFVAAGVPCLGVEPAANIAAVARENGVETLSQFFGAETARELVAAGRLADLVLGNNVLAHVPDIAGFVAGVALLLKPSGRAVLEFPYAGDLVEKTEFDTIYHEHVFYFSLTPLVALFARHGLEIVDVERIALHGGSLRIFAAKADHHPRGRRVDELLALESRQAVASPERYAAFASRVRGVRHDLHELLDRLAAESRRIAAYGAAAKGSTLLNYCDLGPERLEFVVDRSPHKQGLFMPGNHLPILPVEELVRRRPDYALLLTWNFAAEILAQQEAYRRAGGRFILPVPEVRIV